MAVDKSSSGQARPTKQDCLLRHLSFHGELDAMLQSTDLWLTKVAKYLSGGISCKHSAKEAPFEETWRRIKEQEEVKGDLLTGRDVCH
jgi:hypothetical protein